MEKILIANSGIQIFRIPIEIDTKQYKGLFFEENFDEDSGVCTLSLLHGLKSGDDTYFYYKKQLFLEGWLAEGQDVSVDLLRQDGINALYSSDQEEFSNGDKRAFRVSFSSDKTSVLDKFVNQWLPMPYSQLKGTKQKLNAFDCARIKLIPTEKNGSRLKFIAVLAFDTRAEYNESMPDANIVFTDNVTTEMLFTPCSDQLLLMDFISGDKEWRYIQEYLFSLAHPGVANIASLKGNNINRMNFAATYMCLMDCVAAQCDLPRFKIVKEVDTSCTEVEMVVDIGNSRTSALLVENGHFDLVSKLQLTNYTSMTSSNTDVETCQDSFDMRIAFRSLKFGDFGLADSEQFVYPSFVRLGEEANLLIHKAKMNDDTAISTYSSPKRYLWDEQKSAREWKFVSLEGEKPGRAIYIPGISENLTADGKVTVNTNEGGRKFNYPRRTLMTFAVMEMLVQAYTQINSCDYRKFRGQETSPRYISRLVLTCPTAMSDVERSALVRCAKDAVALLKEFYGWSDKRSIIVEPTVRAKNMFDDDKQENQWRYDEATCAQLVYLYGEIGYKYKGASREFMKLYGKARGGHDNSLRVASVDIGAGTTDLMISQVELVVDDYTNSTTIAPEPLFYDSYYVAGDDMMKALINNIIYRNPQSPLFVSAKGKLSYEQYAQKIKDLVGEPHAAKSVRDRTLQRDLNLQFAIPLMQHMLALTSGKAPAQNIEWADVFSEGHEPQRDVIEYANNILGINLENLSWQFDPEQINDKVRKELEPLLKKIATIIFAHDVDIVLLSGRPSSLPAVRDVFLKYYPVSPDRLITLNNYYVGNWYPFCENTGYIKDPKTIVSVGAMVGYFASKQSRLDSFRIDTTKLTTGLVSTAQYIQNEGHEMLLTPDKDNADLRLQSLPKFLDVKQIDIAEYPTRTLYVVDWNVSEIEKRVIKSQGQIPQDAVLRSLIEDEIRALRLKLPISINVQRDAEFIEHLEIASATDNKGNDFPVKLLRIDVQSLGATENYWLDSGVF